MPSSSSAQATYKYIPVTKLRFDPGNPRFFGSKKDKLKNQDELYRELINSFGALGLVDSLLVNGFIPYEPLVVREEEASFFVLEGNRRLAAVKYILENRNEFDGRATKPIDELTALPCIVFERTGADAKGKEQTYLGLRHFSGYKQWQPSSKAEYLARQIESGSSPGELAVKLNTTTSKLKKYLVAMNLLKKARKSASESSSKNFGKFWLLAEALQRTQIQEYLKLEVDSDTFQVSAYDKDRFNNLCRFLYGTEGFPEDEREQELEPVISDTRQISRLAEVLASPEARNALEKHNDLRIALAYVDKSPDKIREMQTNSVEAIKAFIRLRPSESQKNKLKTAIDRLFKGR